MGLFSKKKETSISSSTLYTCWGLRLNSDFVNQLDRFTDIFKVFNEKVYSREEIDKMTDAFKTQGNAINFWEVFVWIDCTIPTKFKTILQTNYVSEIDFEGVKKYNVMKDVTEENVKKAFEYVKQIGFIYGAQFGSIPEEKLYRNVYKYLMDNYRVLLNRHFIRIEFFTHIMENTDTEEYVSYIYLR